MKFEMPNMVELIFDMLEEKVEAMGGVETLKKAAVWEWWKYAGIKDERDFDAALQECYESHKKVMEFKEQLELEMEVLDEDSTSLPS